MLRGGAGPAVVKPQRPGLAARRLLAGVGGARLGVAGGVALGLVSTATVVVQAVMLARLIASAFPEGPPAADRGGLLVGFAAAALGRAACTFASEILGRAGAERVKAHLRAALVLRVVIGRGRAPRSSGEIATLAGRGLDALDVYVARCLPDLVLGAAAPLALVVAVGLIDWISALVLLVVLGLFPLFGAFVGRSSETLARRRWGEVSALGERLVDLFAGLPVLRAFGRSGDQRAALAEASEALRRSSVAALRVAFLSALVLDTLASVSTALVAVPLGLRLVTGSIRLAPALAVLIVAPEVFLPLRRASAEFHESAEGLAAATKAFELLGGDVHDAGGKTGGTDERTPVPDPARVPLRFRGVEIGFAGSPVPLLTGVELEIAPGERVAVIGASGSGKSTLLQLLAGFVLPASGDVLVGGGPLTSLEPEAWRAQTAYLPERPTLLPASLAENLRLAAPDADDAALLAALDALGAGPLVDALDEGLATRLGDGGRALSAGQRQRVALARILLRPATLYLLDEPTAHLDAEAERVAVEALGRAFRGASVVVVTHRPAVLALADRVLSLQGRTVVELTPSRAADIAGTSAAVAT